MPETHLKHRTFLIHTLLQADLQQRYAHQDEQSFSLTAYYLSNSGQGPKLDIYHLPLEVTGFLRDMCSAEYHQEWEAIVHQAWEMAPRRKKKDDESSRPQRNWIYEDLFDLPETAQQFLRIYFLRIALEIARSKADPRTDYSLQNEAHLVSWKITACFLRRIMNMDKERIEEIRKMGDCLAEYVRSQNDRHFFANFRARNYHHFRAALLRANLAHVKRGNPPIITFEPYIEVFERAENDSRANWSLSRDLVFIRMVERLHELGWLGANVDAVPEVIEEESD
jgi:CRISPR-associated protein Cst1